VFDCFGQHVVYFLGFGRRMALCFTPSVPFLRVTSRLRLIPPDGHPRPVFLYVVILTAVLPVGFQFLLPVSPSRDWLVFPEVVCLSKSVFYRDCFDMLAPSTSLTCRLIVHSPSKGSLSLPHPGCLALPPAFVPAVGCVSRFTPSLLRTFQ